MDKVYTYLMIVVSLSFLLYISGNGSSGSVFTLVNGVLNGESIQSSALWLVIYGVLATIGAAVIVQSVIAGNASAAVVGGGVTMSLFLISFVSDILYVLDQARLPVATDNTGLSAVVYYIIAGICIPLAIGFGWSIGQLVFGGND